MAMPLVLLCRHGLTQTPGAVLPGRAPGLHLSDDGRRQAEALARRLGALRRVAAGYASPPHRARRGARRGARWAPALRRLAARHRGRPVVAVFHADPIKAAVAHALGVHLDLFQRLAIAPASVTAIACRAAGPVVLTLNSLAGDLGALA